MKQIRNGVFETNSSSIHSIAIPKQVEEIVTYINVGFDEFGWSFDEVDPLAYLHTAIYEVYGDNAKEKIEELAEILNRHGIGCEFSEPEYDKYGFESGYIDHGYELSGLLDTLFNDEDMLIRYINGARVFTGNDNSDAEAIASIERGEPTYEEYNWETRESTIKENPYYMGDGYDWFYKSN